jgi:hypothetical protein
MRARFWLWGKAGGEGVMMDDVVQTTAAGPRAVGATSAGGEHVSPQHQRLDSRTAVTGSGLGMARTFRRLRALYVIIIGSHLSQAGAGPSARGRPGGVVKGKIRGGRE